MRIYDALKEFLYNKKYFISMYEDKLYVYHYQELIKLNSDEIILKIENFILSIKGNKLSVSQMTKEELMIQGIINEVKYKYEWLPNNKD